MTVKDFFKSHAFKCIAVLMTIVIICGSIIAICNGLFDVSDDELRNRAMTKIFGTVPDNSVQLVISEEQSNNEYGAIKDAYKIVHAGENFIAVKSVGKDGYKSGTITLWVVIAVDESYTPTGIDRVQYDGNTSQTLMGSFKPEYYAEFTKHDEVVLSGGFFKNVTDDGNADISPQSGATKSSNAIVNGVNAALRYVYGGVL